MRKIKKYFGWMLLAIGLNYVSGCGMFTRPDLKSQPRDRPMQSDAHPVTEQPSTGVDPKF